jgi:hypothetical protein
MLVLKINNCFKHFFKYLRHFGGGGHPGQHPGAALSDTRYQSSSSHLHVSKRHRRQCHVSDDVTDENEFFRTRQQAASRIVRFSGCAPSVPRTVCVFVRFFSKDTRRAVTYVALPSVRSVRNA